MTSLILDFETLDTQPDTIVTEIGCIALQRTGDTVAIVDALELFPDILGQLADGRTFSQDTLHWHLRNGTTLKPYSGMLAGCAAALAGFIERHQPRRIWAWGKDFERPLYENLCRKHGITPPGYQFRIFACARDKWQDAFGMDAKTPPRTHRALQDCRDEARDLVAALNHLNLFHAI